MKAASSKLKKVEDTVILLIKEGADVNLFDNKGETALMKAHEKGNKDVAYLIIKNGAAADKLNQFGAQKLADLDNQDFVNVLIKEATAKLKQFNEGQLAKSISGLGMLNHNDKNFVEVWTKAAAGKLDKFDEEELTKSILGLGMLGHQDENFIEIWKKAAAIKLNQFDAEELAKSILGLGMLGHQDENFIKLWIKAAAAKLSEFTEGQLANSVSGLGMLDFKDKNFVEIWIQATNDELSEFKDKELSDLVDRNEEAPSSDAIQNNKIEVLKRAPDSGLSKPVNKMQKTTEGESSSSSNYIGLDTYGINIGSSVIAKTIFGNGNGLIQDDHNNLIIFLPHLNFKLPSFNLANFNFYFAEMIEPLQYLNAGLDVTKKVIHAEDKVQTIAESVYILYLSGGIINYNVVSSWDRLLDNIQKGEYIKAIAPSLQLMVVNRVSDIIDIYAGVSPNVLKAAILTSIAIYKVSEILPFSFVTEEQVDLAGNNTVESLLL